MSKFTRHALFILMAAGTFALTLTAQTSNQAKLVGKWKLDIAKSSVQRELPSLKGSTLIVSQATASSFKYRVTDEFIDGRRRVMGFDGAIDGRPYVYKGAPRGTQLSYIENNGILEGTVVFPDGTVYHDTLTLSPDGNMISSQTNASLPSGRAQSWTEVWNRVK